MPSISQQPSNVNTYHSQQAQANQPTQQAQASQASTEQNQATQNAQPTESQDSAQAENRRNSTFEPGEIHFDRSHAQKVKPESQAESLQSAQDNIAKLREKRIENRLNQLSDEQRRQMVQHIQRDRL